MPCGKPVERQNQSCWVGVVEWAVGDIRKQIYVSSRKSERILSEESVESRVVVPRPLVVQPGAVVLATGVLGGVCG